MRGRLACEGPVAAGACLFFQSRRCSRTSPALENKLFLCFVGGSPVGSVVPAGREAWWMGESKARRQPSALN